MPQRDGSAKQLWDKRYRDSNKMEEGVWRETKRKKQERGRKRWIGTRYLIDSKTDGHTPPEAARKKNIEPERKQGNGHTHKLKAHFLLSFLLCAS